MNTNPLSNLVKETGLDKAVNAVRAVFGAVYGMLPERITHANKIAVGVLSSMSTGLATSPEQTINQ